MSDEDKDEGGKMTFLEHTAELLYCLRIIVISVVFSGFFVAFWPVDIRQLLSSVLTPFSSSLEYTPIVALIMKRMVQDLLPEEASLIAGGLMDTAYVYLMVAVLVGVIISSPVIAYELHKFFAPALYSQERKYANYLIVSFVALFCFGAILAYKVILPITFRILMWFIRSAAALPLINVKDFVSMVVSLILGVALLYTAPVYMILLVDRGILSSQHLTGNRKMVYAAFIIITAIVTPDPTIVSDIILLIPFFVIYEGTILVAKRLDKKRIERERKMAID